MVRVLPGYSKDTREGEEVMLERDANANYSSSPIAKRAPTIYMQYSTLIFNKATKLLGWPKRHILNFYQ